MSHEIMVDGEWMEKWHLKPLGVDEGDRVRFTFNPPRSDELKEKTGTVDRVPDEDHRLRDKYAVIDVDDAGKWALDRGTVSILLDGGPRTRRHGTLIDFEQIEEEG